MSHNVSHPLPTLAQLEAAANSGDPKRLRHLRERLNWMGASGGTVHSAVTGDRALDRLRRLLDNFGPGCLNCAADSDGSSLAHLTLRECASAAPMELIREAAGDSLDCLKRRSDLNRYSAAHFAALNPCSAALKWLVRWLGPKCLRVRATNEQLPVHLSAMRQNSDAMAAFKEALGASCFHHRDAMRRCAFHYAAMNVTRGNGALRWLIDEIGPDPLTARDRLGSSPAHLAAMNQGEDSMRLLRENLGYGLFALEGEDGETVVHSAARNPNGASALAWCVGELGPECLLVPDPLGRTPVHLAAGHQSGQTLRTIADSLGPECLAWPDAEGNTAVHFAARHLDAATLGFIRDALGESAFRLGNHAGRTPAHFAAESGSCAAIDWIAREIGPQCLLAPDAEGITPAVLAGYSE